MKEPLTFNLRADPNDFQRFPNDFSGIRVIGTDGILICAKRSGFIDSLEPELSRLIECGSLLNPAIIHEALKLAGERP